MAKEGGIGSDAFEGTHAIHKTQPSNPHLQDGDGYSHYRVVNTTRAVVNSSILLF